MKQISSLNHESAIFMEFSFHLLLGDIHKSDAATRASVPVAGKGHSWLQEFLDLGLAHSWLIVCVHETLNENWTRSTDSIVTLIDVSSLIDQVDLVAVLRVPARADDGCAQMVPVIEDDLSHHGSGRLHWWEITQLGGLHVHVVPHILADGRGVRRGSWSLAVDSLVNWLKLIWTFIANEHALNNIDQLPS